VACWVPEGVLDHLLLRATQPLAERRERGEGLVVRHQAGSLVDHVELLDAGLLHSLDQPVAHLRDGELLGDGRAGVDVPAGVAAAMVEEGEPVVLRGKLVGRLGHEARQRGRVAHRQLTEVLDLRVLVVVQDQELGRAERLLPRQSLGRRVLAADFREVDHDHDVDVGGVRELGYLVEVLDHQLWHVDRVADGVDHHRPVGDRWVVTGRRSAEGCTSAPVVPPCLVVAQKLLTSELNIWS
jgi:hypothetical protein